MPEYVLLYDVPYEGISKESFRSLDDVRKWLIDNKRTYGWTLDNITLYTPSYIDVYELMENKKDE